VPKSANKARELKPSKKVVMKNSDTDVQPEKTNAQSNENKVRKLKTSKIVVKKNKKHAHNDQPAHATQRKIGNTEKKVRKAQTSRDTAKTSNIKSNTNDEKAIYMSIEYKETTWKISADKVQTVSHLVDDLAKHNKDCDTLPTIAGWEDYDSNTTISSICINTGELATFSQPMHLFAYDSVQSPMYNLEIHDYFVFVDEIDGDVHRIQYAEPKPRQRNYQREQNSDHNKRPIYTRVFENSDFVQTRSNNVSKNFSGRNRNLANRNQPLWQMWH
jgi:hypothetical protein